MHFGNHVADKMQFGGQRSLALVGRVSLGRLPQLGYSKILIPKTAFPVHQQHGAAMPGSAQDYKTSHQSLQGAAVPGGVLGARRGLAANVSISWGTVCGRPGGMTPPKPPCPSLGLNVVWH